MPNSKVLESKKAIVDALATKLQGSTAAVFVDYKGITVAQDTELRNKFREAGVEYTVVKNTLTRFAANKAGYNQFDEMLNGTTSLATTTGDPIAPARIVCEFAKKNKNVLKIKGGFVEGSVLSVEQLQGFGELPSKDALIAQVLGTFLAPISALAALIVGIVSIVRLAMGRVVTGLTGAVILLLFLSGLIMVGLGIIGYYLGNIYMEIQDRPRFIVSETCGVRKKT